MSSVEGIEMIDAVGDQADMDGFALRVVNEPLRVMSIDPGALGDFKGRGPDTGCEAFVHDLALRRDGKRDYVTLRIPQSVVDRASRNLQRRIGHHVIDNLPPSHPEVFTPEPRLPKVLLSPVGRRIHRRQTHQGVFRNPRYGACEKETRRAGVA